jgi:hypothetical protein
MAIVFKIKESTENEAEKNIFYLNKLRLFCLPPNK